jgi:hypothetical protein
VPAETEAAGIVHVQVDDVELDELGVLVGGQVEAGKLPGLPFRLQLTQPLGVDPHDELSVAEKTRGVDMPGVGLEGDELHEIEGPAGGDDDGFETTTLRASVT